MAGNYSHLYHLKTPQQGLTCLFEAVLELFVTKLESQLITRN